MPSAFALRRIATGFKAIRQPTDGRHSYLPRELARELGVNECSVYRWLQRGVISADTSSGFMVIPVDEAMRFSREGPPRIDPACRLRQRDPASGHFLKGPPP